MSQAADKRAFGVDKPATARARKIAQEYLGSTFSVEGVLEDFPTISQRIRAAAEEMVPALKECLGLDDFERRLMAAWMLASFGERVPHTMSKGTYDRACQILVDALDWDAAPELLASILFSELSKVPNAVVKMREIAGMNRASSVYAAKALCRWELGDSKMLGVLRDALNGNNPILAGVGACALLEIDVARSEAINKLHDRLPAMGIESQIYILEHLKRMGFAAAELIEPVKAIAARKAGHPAVRRIAIAVLGTITKSPERVAPTLLQALKSSDWRIYGSAMESLSSIGRLPATVVDRLIGLLSDKDENQRTTAAYGIELLGDRGLKAVPSLIARLQEEDKREAADHMVRALVSIGEAAIPDLLAAMRVSAPKRVDDLMRVVAYMGEPGARALAQVLPNIPDERERITLVVTVGLMGREAVPAIPILAQILDETTDDELAMQVVLALAMCGPYGLSAIPSLVRCLAERGSSDNLVGAWAERALWGMREQAVRAIEEAMRGAEESQHERLSHTLNALQSWDDSTYAYLEELGRDDLLATFIAVGDALTEMGPISWRKMPNVLKRRLKERKIVWSGFAMGNRMLGENTKKLGTLLACALTTHGGNEPVGGTLTDAGRRVLQDAKEYLRRKALKHRQNEIKR